MQLISRGGRNDVSVAMKGDGHGRVELMNGYLTLRLRKQLRPSLHFSNPLTHRVELQTRKRDPSKHLNVPTTTTLTHAPPSSALHPRTRRSLKPTQLLAPCNPHPNFPPITFAHPPIAHHPSPYRHVQTRQRRHPLHRDRRLGPHPPGRPRHHFTIRRPSAQKRNAPAESKTPAGGSKPRQDGAGHKMGLRVPVRENGGGRGASVYGVWVDFRDGYVIYTLTPDSRKLRGLLCGRSKIRGLLR